MVKTSGIQTLPVNLPADVDLYVRSNSATGKTVWILVNFGKDAASVSLPAAMTDVLAGGEKSSVTLEQYGVAVLSRK